MKFLSLAFCAMIGGSDCQYNDFPEDQNCVLIYYDKVPQNSDYDFGEVYSIYLRNLLGHFPEIQQIVSPIERYQKGEIEKCRSTIYIGSYFENTIPEDFFTDFKNTEKHVAWLGYNMWMFPEEDQIEMWGHKYTGLTKLNTEDLSPEGLPSFYKYIEYKGETFHKFSKWVVRDGKDVFAAPFEMIKLVPAEDVSERNIEVLATARHSNTNQSLPYAIRNKNKFYIADVPFSYAHEADRYLIFSDILFDILDAKPRRDKRIAFLRIEDVHPLSNISELYTVLDVFRDEDVPLHVSLIPLFYDPLYRYDRSPSEEFVTIKEHSAFKIWLKEAQKMNASFVWHGVTHQYKEMKNPHTGYTSDDFEFWDAVKNQPVGDDSVDFVLNRLELGSKFLADVGIFPKAWLTPHYQASALDYRIFAKVFPWNVGRVIYFLDDPQGLDPVNETLQEELYLHNRTQNGTQIRKRYFKDYTNTTRGKWFGQLYPYEIYNDIYGQRVIPEILGNPQPFESEHVWYPRRIEEIISDAKRNRVIRDSWASLFFHSYLLTDLKNDGIGEYPGDTRPLIKLIREIKDLGYEFMPLNDFIDENQNIKPKKTIILEMEGP